MWARHDDYLGNMSVELGPQVKKSVHSNGILNIGSGQEYAQNATEDNLPNYADLEVWLLVVL